MRREASEMDELTIWRTANQVVKAKGDDALAHARTIACERQRGGDMRDAALWEQIAGVIAAMTRQSLPTDSPQ